ncbi:protein FMC1 homolog [Hypanus sabinus]|uniref:protein FMC1 homolog n=1 Tax=Hypanus sabinus TaxID=79690 RepID=UPI0028C4C757|nr:protein FMC1 homolog [Hypanus sabinus]
MAAASHPLRVFRALLKELRSQGSNYRHFAAYRYITEQFRRNQVTSEKLCRAQQELVHQASTYLCLLQNARQHLALHHKYHGKGERSAQGIAQQVGFMLPRQPGGKGWEK